MPKIKLGCGFVLLIALIYFFDDSGVVLAMFPPIIIHEFSHIAAMLIFKAKVVEIKASLTGLSMDYSGYLTNRQKQIIVAAGPIMGLLVSIIFSILGTQLESDFLVMSAGIGIVLNIFNILPIFPLDGGRFLRYSLIPLWGYIRAKKASDIVSLVVSFLLVFVALWLIYANGAFMLIIPSIWLLAFNLWNCCKSYKYGI